MLRFALRSIGLLLLSFIAFLICDLSNPFNQRKTLKPADYIVVLSAGMNKDGSAGTMTKARTMAGVELYKQGFAPKIVLSGGTLAKHETDLASAMAKVAVDAGVPAADLIVENRSRSTLQNAIFTAETIDKRQPMILVTSPFHMARSILTFRVIGFDDFQSVTGPNPQKLKSRMKGIVREVPAFWFNLVRLPIWKILNLFERNPSTDWILA